ncbi:MAG: hypothetical protein ABII27_01850 [bacterium]
MGNIKQAVASWFKFDNETGNKYKTLAIVKGLLKVFAWLFLVVGVLFTIIILIFGGTDDAPRASSIMVLFFTVIEFIFLYTLAELIAIFVNIENNTQKTARLLGAREEK